MPTETINANTRFSPQLEQNIHCLCLHFVSLIEKKRWNWEDYRIAMTFIDLGVDWSGYDRLWNLYMDNNLIYKNERHQPVAECYQQGKLKFATYTGRQQVRKFVKNKELISQVFPLSGCELAEKLLDQQYYCYGDRDGAFNLRGFYQIATN